MTTTATAPTRPSARSRQADGRTEREGDHDRQRQRNEDRLRARQDRDDQDDRTEHAQARSRGAGRRESRGCWGNCAHGRLRFRPRSAIRQAPDDEAKREPDSRSNRPDVTPPSGASWLRPELVGAAPRRRRRPVRAGAQSRSPRGRSLPARSGAQAMRTSDDLVLSDSTAIVRLHAAGHLGAGSLQNGRSTKR